MTVTEEWTALTAALAGLSDRALTFLPPAPAGEVARAEAATRAVWPDQLREFYSLHNGQDPDVERYHGELLPSSWFFRADYLTQEYKLLVGYGEAELREDPDLRAAIEGAEAGTTAFVFLPSYIPLCGSDSNYYFCDTRPGPHSGCIRHWWRDDADNMAAPLFSSIADMLAAVRISVTTNTELHHGWQPNFLDEPDRPVDRGALTWINE